MEQDKTQLNKFKEAAKDLGCDENEERFDTTVKKLATAKPKPDAKSDK